MFDTDSVMVQVVSCPATTVGQEDDCDTAKGAVGAVTVKVAVARSPSNDPACVTLADPIIEKLAVEGEPPPHSEGGHVLQPSLLGGQGVTIMVGSGVGVGYTLVGGGVMVAVGVTNGPGVISALRPVGVAVDVGTDVAVGGTAVLVGGTTVGTEVGAGNVFVGTGGGAVAVGGGAVAVGAGGVDVAGAELE